MNSDLTLLDVPPANVPTTDNTSSTDEAEGSAGHAIGQIVGDWWEKYIALPVLEGVATELSLYLDSRFKNRSCRDSKLQWYDSDGHVVDYDFVLELGGTTDQLGVPVGFVEVFWRRGARHSRDKARDDSGKLIPMRYTYPTARFLGIMASGDFSKPARDFIRDRDIELFLAPKAKIIEAFTKHGIEIDYPDRTPESDKRRLAEDIRTNLTETKKQEIAKTLVELVGQVTFSGYVSTVKGRLAALPQEIRFVESLHSSPVSFDTIADASAFLENPIFSSEGGSTSYRYEITYTDGAEFVRDVPNLDALKGMHQQLAAMADHISSILR
jgi:hypothetical protein